MPLIKYFGFVGSALVLLLIGLGWCLPQQVVEPTWLDRKASHKDSLGRTGARAGRYRHEFADDRLAAERTGVC